MAQPTTQASRNDQLFERARKSIPGGVNSPVRAFKAVGGTPRFVQRAHGAYFWDADDKRYIDYIGSWGPMILGHGHPAVVDAVQKALLEGFSFGAPTEREVQLAEEIIKLVPSIEMVRLVSSGTEAAMSAIRLARGATGRSKIIKFEGCYHGHADALLVKAGSGLATFGNPTSAGVPPEVVQHTLVLEYNNLVQLEACFALHGGSTACLMIEPIAGNMNFVRASVPFMKRCRELCTQHGVLLSFDEVMTGFRLAKGGAQERFGVLPDMTTLGKIIGGGMPVGAYGGRADIMNMVSPAGPVYQAGTLSGNPLAMAAGLTMLHYLNDHPEVYTRLDEIGDKLATGFRASVAKLGLNYTVNQVGSMFTLFMTDRTVTDLDTAKTCDVATFGRYFHALLDRGVYIAPAQFESLFVSTALTDDLIEEVIRANEGALNKVKNEEL